MIPETEIAKMKERVEKATKAPWRPQVWRGHLQTSVESAEGTSLFDVAWSKDEQWEANQAFLIEARTDIPALLAERSELLSKIEAQSRELVRLRDGWVSVKDRLPRTWSWIVIGGIVQYTPARPDGDTWEFWPEYCEHAVPAEMVTHWRELPAPTVMEKQGVVDVPKEKQ